MEKIDAAIPKKKLEVEDLPQAFVVTDIIFDEMVAKEGTADRDAIKQGVWQLRYKGVPVFKKSKVIEIT